MITENEMDVAADKAIQELQALADKMTSDEKRGAAKLVSWLKANYMKAGYKKLCRPLVHNEIQFS